MINYTVEGFNKLDNSVLLKAIYQIFKSLGCVRRKKIEKTNKHMNKNTTTGQ